MNNDSRYNPELHCIHRPIFEPAMTPCLSMIYHVRMIQIYAFSFQLMKDPCIYTKKCYHLSHYCHILLRNNENPHFYYLTNLKKLNINFQKKQTLKVCFYIYFSFFIFSNSSGKLFIVCNVNGLADLTTKLFTFHTKLNVEITSPQIL